MFGGMAVVVGGFLWWKRTPPGIRAVDRMKFRLPVIGQIFHYYSVTRFTRTLGTMISSGVPILDGLDIVAKTAGNVVIEDGPDTLHAQRIELDVHSFEGVIFDGHLSSEATAFSTSERT